MCLVLYIDKDASSLYVGSVCETQIVIQDRMMSAEQINYCLHAVTDRPTACPQHYDRRILTTQVRRHLQGLIGYI